MKKFSSKKVLLFTLFIVLMFTVVAYAYTEGVRGSLSDKFTEEDATGGNILKYDNRRNRLYTPKPGAAWK